MQHQVCHDMPEASDALWDTSHQAMAERFGRRTRQQMREGRDPKEAAKLAFSYARLVLDAPVVIVPRTVTGQVIH